MYNLTSLDQVRHECCSYRPPPGRTLSSEGSWTFNIVPLSTALIRERDELVAALEVRDRIKGESTPVEDGPYSSEEVIAEVFQFKSLFKFMTTTA